MPVLCPKFLMVTKSINTMWIEFSDFSKKVLHQDVIKGQASSNSWIPLPPKSLHSKNQITQHSISHVKCFCWNNSWIQSNLLLSECMHQKKSCTFITAWTRKSIHPIEHLKRYSLMSTQNSLPKGFHFVFHTSSHTILACSITSTEMTLPEYLPLKVIAQQSDAYLATRPLRATTSPRRARNN